MGTFTTEVPTSAAGSKSKRNGADSLENEAIGLDVSVRIHGSQVTAVVLDTTEHVEPFEEDTSTMIVFPRGAVVKLRARVRTGHAVVLTNLATKQTALCRIIQVNSAANVSHYVKLEFIQPVPGFWGVHFPSEANAPAEKQEEHAAFNNEPEKPAAQTPPAALTPVKSGPPIDAPSTPQPAPHVDAPQPTAKPLWHETAKESLKPAPAPPMNYGFPEDTHTNEVVPLAAAPTKRAPFTPKASAATPAPSPAPSRAAASSSAEAPIFDSLSTGEEVFGKEATATAEETIILKSDKKAAQAFVRSLDPASLLQAGEAPKRHTGLKIFLSVAAVGILAAGAVFYVRQYRGNARQNLSVATAADIPHGSSAASSSATPAEITPGSLAPSAAGVSAPVGPSGKHAAIQPAADQTTITVTPVHSSAKNSTPELHPTISNGLANIYAGDLAARPQAAQRNHLAVSAPLPTIDSTPRDLVGASTNAGLGSLVGGATSKLPALPKPVEAAPIVRGGQVTSPRLLRRVNPSYPALAVASHVDGDVEIQAVIDRTGKVTSTKAISGPTLLRDAAMNAVRQWKYSPATLDGKPITVEYKVTVRFRLGQ